MERAEWLSKKLKSYIVTPKDNRSDAPMISICSALRCGDDVSVYAQYQAATIDYIKLLLRNAKTAERQAFFEFVVYSEIVDVSSEVRNTLFSILPTSSADDLALEIFSALLRVNKPPSANLAGRFIPLLRQAHAVNPKWKYIGVMVAMANRALDANYGKSDLIEDIAKLSKTERFEQALMIRNAIWATSRLGIDSISILQSIRSIDTETVRDFPSTADLGNHIHTSRQNIAYTN